MAQALVPRRDRSLLLRGDARADGSQIGAAETIGTDETQQSSSPKHRDAWFAMGVRQRDKLGPGSDRCMCSAQASAREGIAQVRSSREHRSALVAEQAPATSRNSSAPEEKGRPHDRSRDRCSGLKAIAASDSAAIAAKRRLLFDHCGSKRALSESAAFGGRAALSRRVSLAHRSRSGAMGIGVR
jgi:hypothetical protein